MSRGVKTSVEKVSRNTTSTYTVVEKQSRDTRTEARSIHQLSRIYEGLGNFSINPPSCQGSVEIAIRTKLKSSTDN